MREDFYKPKIVNFSVKSSKNVIYKFKLASLKLL